LGQDTDPDDARATFFNLVAHSRAAAAAALADPDAALFWASEGPLDASGVHPLVGMFGSMAPGPARDLVASQCGLSLLALAGALACAPDGRGRGGDAGAGDVTATGTSAVLALSELVAADGGAAAAVCQHHGMLFAAACCVVQRIGELSGAAALCGAAVFQGRALAWELAVYGAQESVASLVPVVRALPPLCEVDFAAGAEAVRGSPSEMIEQPLSRWRYPKLLSTALACLRPLPPRPAAGEPAAGRVWVLLGTLRCQAARLLSACALRGPEYARAIQAAMALVPSGGDAAFTDALQLFKDASGGAYWIAW
jgi:hypothetical protein